LDAHLPQGVRSMLKKRQVALGPLVGLAVVLGAAVAVASSDRGPASDGAPVQVAPARGHIPQVAGAPASAVDRLASGLKTVRNPIVAPATDSGVSGMELRFDLRVNSFAGADIAQAIWEGNLLGGAVADTFAASGLPPLVSVDATLVDPHGSRQPMGGGLGNVVRDQIFRPITARDIAAVTERAQKLGLRNVAVSRRTVIQDALVVMVDADDPARAVDDLRADGNALRALLGVPPASYEGVYLEVRDQSGQPAYIEATAPRAGAGTRWARAGLGIDNGRGTMPTPE
jgi:hypothetical protein